MKSKNLTYCGNTLVYLQGAGALQPLEKAATGYIVYFVGSKESCMIIKDYRQEPIQAAEAAIRNNFRGEFSEIFNQPAYIEVFEDSDNIEIIMCPGHKESASSILWLGIICDGKIQVHEFEWEIFKSISDNSTAFICLVNG